MTSAGSIIISIIIIIDAIIINDIIINAIISTLIFRLRVRLTVMGGGADQSALTQNKYEN